MVKELQEFFKADWEDPEIAMKWYMAGWKNLEYALKWFKADWEDPEIAMKWHKAGWRNPKKCKEWFKAGWEDPEVAKKWHKEGWRKPYFTFKWLKTGWKDPVLAMIWHNARWNNPKVAYEYFSSGFEDPWEAYYLYYSKGLKPEDIGKIKKEKKMKDFNYDEWKKAGWKDHEVAEEVTVTTKIPYLDYVRIRTLNKKTKFKLIKLYETLLLEGLKSMEEKYERTNNE